jgi:hypothetical protein
LKTEWFNAGLPGGEITVSGRLTPPRTWDGWLCCAGEETISITKYMKKRFLASGRFCQQSTTVLRIFAQEGKMYPFDLLLLWEDH